MHFLRNRPFICALATIAVFALSGCSKKHGGRMEVSGKVRLGDQVIDDGMVSFEPLDGQETRATAMINGGEYLIPQESGLLPGRYLIRVNWGDGKTAINPVDENNPPGPSSNTNIISKDRVPREWNIDSNQERTVTRDGPNRFDFLIP